MRKIPVVVVDDQELVRQGLKGLINGQPDLSVAGEATTGAEALECVGRMGSGIVILDLELPDMTGFDVLRQLSSHSTGLPVLVCSSFPASQFASRAIEAGAAGYICKTAGGLAVLAAVRTLAKERFA
jgi:DNA-binding NarL/FixJ family response regulator